MSRGITKNPIDETELYEKYSVNIKEGREEGTEEQNLRKPEIGSKMIGLNLDV